MAALDKAETCAAPRTEPPGRAFLAGGGEMGALIRARDWSASPMGPPEGWPAELKTAVSLMLAAKQPVYIGWGPDQISLYNDGYIPICGEKHPQGLGRPAAVLWAEIWAELGPLNAQVMGGESLFFQDMPFALAGRGSRGLSYFSFSYTPLRDGTGAVRGIFCSAIETTDKVTAEQRLADEAQRWRDTFEQAPSFICTLRGPEHVFDFVNAAHRRLFGSADWVGKPVREAFPDIADQGFYEALDEVRTSGRQMTFSAQPVRFRSPEDGTERVRWLDFLYAPIQVDGKVDGIFCEGFDVTGRIEAQEALAQHEEQLRLATEAAEVGLWDLDPVADDLFWPPRVKAMFGIGPDEPISMADFYAGLHPRDRQRVTEAFAAALDPKIRALYDVEYRTIGKSDGVVRWVAAKGRGIFDESGRCVRVIGTALDISGRKDAENRLRLMVNELNHRVKNSLATVQAIVTQTLRRPDVPADVRAALTERLVALARANDVLTDESWSRASLRELANNVAAPYEPGGPGERFDIRGPPVNLAPKTAIAVALAFHELATNAAKYGALSAAGGRVRIEWSVRDEAAGRRLTLTWTESGGPRVTAPTAAGFGTRLLTRGLAGELRGGVRVDYRAEGVACTMDALLASPEAEDEAADGDHPRQA